MAYIYLQTNFCYNGSQVTYAASTRSYYIYSWASLDIAWYGWDEPDVTQYLYTSGGHINGGVYTYSQATFGQCVLHYGCLGFVHPWTETRDYWNGTYLSSSSA